MPHVDPHSNEKAEIRADKRVIKIVQRLACRQEEIADIMCNEDSETNPREVETVTQADES